MLNHILLFNSESMKIISKSQIRSLNISPATCVEWVKESFSLKKYAQLPAKVSVHPNGVDFYTAMPCLLPESYNRYCLKLVSRIKDAKPALCSNIQVYESSTGNLLALMDCDWITAMRTGAVATLAAQTFRKSGNVTYCIVGLGNVAIATMLCLLEVEPDVMHHVLLYKFMNEADLFMERFKHYSNVMFETYDNLYELFSHSDVIFSCVTQADSLMCEDEKCFRPGVTLIPIHTRGFQNCDLFFDKVFGDDTAHIKGFKYFDQFKYFAEIQDVIEGMAEGRINDTERIINYNVGLGLHDALFASKIYDLVDNAIEVNIEKETKRLWV